MDAEEAHGLLGGWATPSVTARALYAKRSSTGGGRTLSRHSTGTVQSAASRNATAPPLLPTPAWTPALCGVEVQHTLQQQVGAVPRAPGDVTAFRASIVVHGARAEGASASSSMAFKDTYPSPNLLQCCRRPRISKATSGLVSLMRPHTKLYHQWDLEPYYVWLCLLKN